MEPVAPDGPGRQRLAVRRRPDGATIVTLAGRWRLADGVLSADAVSDALATASVLHFDAARVDDWDTSLVAFVWDVCRAAAPRRVPVDASGLPDGARRLLALAGAGPEVKAPRREEWRSSWLARLGAAAIDLGGEVRNQLSFLGELAFAAGRLVRGRARWRRSDLWLVARQAGAEALPIVSLISFLVGVIMAFGGAIQLRQFGAQIFVANLVAVAMARDMGALMTAVIMAGRTGAAFAAQLGTMRVSEEIDALQTMGLPPMGFLVLPRMLALVLMMPLLTVYAIALGMLGGATIGVFLLHLAPAQYWQQTTQAIGLHDLLAGMIKGMVFGILVPLAGCLRGMQCGRSAQAVGAATTSAVVTSIVLIIVSDALLTALFDVVEI